MPLASRLSKFPDAVVLPLLPLLIRLLYRFASSNREPLSCALRRLTLYIAVMLFRMFVLYSFFNVIEDSFVRQSGSACWYQSYTDDDCFGRLFDFSDHIVLFYSQLLPIPLCETIYAWTHPYWGSRRVEMLIPILLLLGHGYWQWIVATGSYKTAAYFHPPGEIVVGLVVSGITAVPLWLMQTRRKGVFGYLSRFFFEE